MFTFEQANDFLLNARMLPSQGYVGRKLCNNTYMCKADHNDPNGDIEIILHWTTIVTIHKNNTYTLNTGGWNTHTTRDRINHYSPANLYTKKGGLRIADYDYVYKFRNGIKVDAHGSPINEKPLISQEALQKRRSNIYARMDEAEAKIDRARFHNMCQRYVEMSSMLEESERIGEFELAPKDKWEAFAHLSHKDKKMRIPSGRALEWNHFIELSNPVVALTRYNTLNTLFTEHEDEIRALETMAVLA